MLTVGTEFICDGCGEGFVKRLRVQPRAFPLKIDMTLPGPPSGWGVNRVGQVQCSGCAEAAKRRIIPATVLPTAGNGGKPPQ